MATIVQQYDLQSIFRYKFSESFMDLLRLFANNHRFDEPAVFKERWMRWTCNELNIQKIIKEEKRLVESGYKGNITIWNIEAFAKIEKVNIKNGNVNLEGILLKI